MQGYIISQLEKKKYNKKRRVSPPMARSSPLQVGDSPPESHDERTFHSCTSDVIGVLLLVLGYLKLPELLAFQSVSRLFRDAVAEDSLLWRRVAVERPLSGRLTDDALLRITSRAAGKLESLALNDCWEITDNGLMQVVDRNPGLVKVITRFLFPPFL